MDDIIIFGDKNVFAIQLGLHINIEKCKLCFYVQGKRMGSFTKGGELKYSIQAYDTFTTNKVRYYDPVFDEMTPTKIRKYFVDEMFSLMKSNRKEKQEEYQIRRRFNLFFGAQFTNDGSDIILLYKNDEVKFIYTPPKKTSANEYMVSYSKFCDTFNNYIAYCRKKNLIEYSSP